jgi:hypothetical protein
MNTLPPAPAPDQARLPGARPGVAVIHGPASGANGRIRFSFASEIAQLWEGLAPHPARERPCDGRWSARHAA